MVQPLGIRESLSALSPPLLRAEGSGCRTGRGGFAPLRLLTEPTACVDPGGAIADNAKTRRQGSKRLF
jgi:hypothetical protein